MIILSAICSTQHSSQCSCSVMAHMKPMKACNVVPTYSTDSARLCPAGAHLGLQGVNDQGHAHKELGRELGEVLPEAADVGVDLLHAAGVDEVAAGALIDVPGGEQAQGAFPRQGLQEVAQVV